MKLKRQPQPKRVAIKGKKAEQEAKGDVFIGDDGEHIEYEDEFGDDVEDEVVDGKYVTMAKTDEDYENGVIEEEDDEDDDNGEETKIEGKESMDMSELKKNLPKKSVYLPTDGLDPDEDLEYDPSAYDLLYRFTLDWPSLSFDFIRDNLGSSREKVYYALFISIFLVSSFSLFCHWYSSY